MTDAAANRVSLAGISSGVGIAADVAAAGYVPVTVNGTTVTMLVSRDITIAAGDPVVFVRARSQWAVIARTGTVAPTPPVVPLPPVPPPKPVTVTGSKTFTPVETRSRQGSKWRTDNDNVYQGQYGGNGNHYGCAFYGSGPRSLAGSTVTSAQVKIRRRSAGGITAAQSTTLWLMTNATRPGGAPTLTSSTAGPSLAWGASTTFTVPTSWAQALVNGTAGGLAVYDSDGSPYVILSGRGDWSGAFSLTIKWKRG